MKDALRVAGAVLLATAGVLLMLALVAGIYGGLIGGTVWVFDKVIHLFQSAPAKPSTHDWTWPEVILILGIFYLILRKS